jgi:molybdenum cofactor biosynthesis enzyme MoaA
MFKSVEFGGSRVAADRSDPALEEIRLELTGRCNVACAYCYLSRRLCKGGFFR